MTRLLQLVALTIGVAAGTVASAQITSPDKLVVQPPRNPARTQRPAPADDLQWMWQYAKPQPNGRASDLRLDARFHSMLEREFKQPQAMWGPAASREPLAVVIPLFVSEYGTVTTENNRYYAVDGCVPSFCPAHGLLWIDLGTPHPLAVFAAVNWSTGGHSTDETKADYNLWLFANRDLDTNALPLALTESIAHWDARLSAAHRLVPHIAQAILVEPDGQPHVLDPAMTGANTIKPQPDTVTPQDPDRE